MNKFLKTSLRVFGGFIALIFVTGFIYTKYFKPTDTFTYSVAQEAPKEYSEFRAKQDCRDAVQSELKDPDADMDALSSFYVVKEPRGFGVKVTGTYRNGFNALRRFAVKCIVDNGRILSTKEIM